MDETRAYSGKRDNALMAFFFLVAALTIAVSSMVFTRRTVFWDIGVYTRAIADYAVGGNPYRTDVGLAFTYHPYILKLFRIMNDVLPLELILAIFYLIATAYFFRQLFLVSRDRCRSIDSREFLIIFILLVVGAIGYGGTGVFSFLSGNMSVFMHFALVGILINFIRARSYAYIYCFISLVWIFSFIKPYYLAYLFLLFVFLPLGRAIVYGATVVITIALAWFSAAYVMPGEYSSFMNALYYQTLGKGDLGYAIYGLTKKFLSHRGAMLVHLIVLSVIMYLSYFLIPKILRFNHDDTLRSFLMIVAVIFLNPRMKEYDFIVAMICLLFLGFFIYGKHVFSLFLVGLSVAAVPLLGRTAVNVGIPVHWALLNIHRFQVLGLILIALVYIVRRNMDLRELT